MIAVHTIGHSNRSIATLVELLKAHDIRVVVDIRAFPRSRRHPHFDRSALAGSLASHDIAYHWAGDALGGFRKPRKISMNTALTDAAFRGFADYMASETFSRAMTDLVDLAAYAPLTIMCAEADHRHCHRQFIADDLLRRGIDVRHVISTREIQAHQPNACLDNSHQPPVYNKHVQGDLFASPLSGTDGRGVAPGSYR